MTVLEIMLAVLTALSGIGNLAQWVNIKALRKKSKYEADELQVEVLKKTILLQAEEIKRLQERQRELEEKIERLQEGRGREPKTKKKAEDEKSEEDPEDEDDEDWQKNVERQI